MNLVVQFTLSWDDLKQLKLLRLSVTECRQGDDASAESQQRTTTSCHHLDMYYRVRATTAWGPTHSHPDSYYGLQMTTASGPTRHHLNLCYGVRLTTAPGPIRHHLDSYYGLLTTTVSGPTWTHATIGTSPTSCGLELIM